MKQITVLLAVITIAMAGSIDPHLAVVMAGSTERHNFRPA